MVLDPYSTSYGALVNTSRIKKDLLNYVATTPLSNLNYEFQDYPKTKLVFITGCTQEERDLAVFDHTTIIEYKGIKYIVADLRKYVRQLNDQPISLTEIIKDLANATYIINRSIFIMDFVDEKLGIYRKFYKPSITAYAEFISYIVNTAITLTPQEFYSVKFVATWFGYSLFATEEDFEDYIPQIEAFLNTVKVGATHNEKRS